MIRSCVFVIVGLLYVLPCMSVTAEVKDEKAREAFRADMKARQELRGKSIGFIDIGAEGQWLFSSFLTSGESLYVVRDGEGFALYLEKTPRGEPVAKVLPDGTVQVLDEAILVGPAVPDRWPMHKKQKKLKTPHPDEVIAKRTEGATKKKPKGCIGTFILLSTGVMLKTDDSAKRDVVWAVKRSDGGLDFIHSGPVKSGVFMRVTPKREITYPADSGRPAPKGLWPYYEHEGERPALPSSGFVIQADPSTGDQVIVFKTGIEGVVPPLSVD